MYLYDFADNKQKKKKWGKRYSQEEGAIRKGKYENPFHISVFFFLNTIILVYRI